ncbi:MAG: hypothetical protein JO140_01070 [Candidatus Eremiobacteraeota bacterium]|nr:hypothetical protein [Candidatus Eremiobacteraeota bacterium]
MVELGEAKAAVDQVRRQVNAARAAPPPSAVELLRLLSQYAALLESADALAEADFIWNEALELVASSELAGLEAAEAFLRQGLLYVKMHNYDGAVAKLKEAARLAEELSGADELDRQIVLAKAWRGQSQAFEALGEFSAATNALDVLTGIKRQIRFIAFSPSRGR